MKSDNQRLFKNISAPLGFFAFALLATFIFLGAVLVHGDLEKNSGILYIGAGLSLTVILVVTFLVWFKPDHLTYDMEAHLRDKGKPPFGTEDGVAELSPNVPPTSSTEKH